MEPSIPVSTSIRSQISGPPSVTTSRQSRAQTEFTQGGDLVLRSTDGQEFTAHSIILSLASPVFADMFAIGSQSSGETIELAETGEMVDLILKFIYPRQSPTISSFEMLEKAMHVANKYQLDDMYQQLRQKLSAHGSPVSVYSDPLKALGIASTHGLKEEIQLASSLAHGNYDFTTVDGLLKLAESAPAAITWVVVIGIPSVKNKAISEVLFGYHQGPMYPPSTLCDPCREHRFQSGTRHSPPEWEARWSYGLAAELMKRPIQNWKPCFDLPFLYESIGRHGGTPIHIGKATCTCLEKLSLPPDDYGRTRSAGTPRFPNRFSQWSYRVYDHLTARLARLEELERLIE